ncbi:Uncharacterised protein [Mycobacteroides abscessus subsp. abscessus]|nr:Uncharacterised protein [Mycobacteroides abscessus subsp. abscessus]
MSLSVPVSSRATAITGWSIRLTLSPCASTTVSTASTSSGMSSLTTTISVPAGPVLTSTRHCPADRVDANPTCRRTRSRSASSIASRLVASVRPPPEPVVGWCASPGGLLALR